MANWPAEPRAARTGCCCEVMIGYDNDAERRLVARDKTHACCPLHGLSGQGVRRAPV